MRDLIGRPRRSLPVGLLLALALLAIVPGCAAPPTVEGETYTLVTCQGVVRDMTVNVTAQRSATGTSGDAHVAYLDGNFVAEGWAEGAWTDSTFTMTIPVGDAVKGPEPFAEVQFAGSYGNPGTPQSADYVSVDGNTRFKDSTTTTPLDVTVDRLTYDGTDASIESCEAKIVSWTHERSNPLIRLSQKSRADCEMSNADDHHVFRKYGALRRSTPIYMEVTHFAGMTEIGPVGVSYAAGMVDFGDDNEWTGRFKLFLFDENVTSYVPASAVRERTGMAYPDVEEIEGERRYQLVRPYRVTLTVQLPDGPAVLTCRIEEVLQTGLRDD